MINYRMIANVLGILVGIVGILMLSSVVVALIYPGGHPLRLLATCLAVITLGFVVWRWIGGRNAETRLGKRDGFLIVTLGWLLMTFAGTLPYLVTGSISSFGDAFFETMSGFTTTGASVLRNIEDLHPSILLWRSLSQWIGGMGIIVMTIAILPILGIGGMELFLAEAPGPTSDKIHPRIKETAKRLWLIYVSLTAVLSIVLWIEGMSFFDALNHAFTTMSTGGFSTKQSSIAFFNSASIEWTLVLFMFMGGTNFTLLYFLFKGKIDRLRKSDEFKNYVGIVFVTSLLIAGLVYSVADMGISQTIRASFFEVVSVITTTGFVAYDHTSYSTVVTFLFLFMAFIGAMAGSTSGGIKIVRHMALGRNCFYELKRVLHPRAVIPVKINGKTVHENIITNVLVFVLIYLVIFVTSTLIMSFLGLDFQTAIGSVAATLSNVGPGIGSVGPTGDFADIPMFGKWFLSIIMLIGRLELFTVLVIFTPYFWRSN
jgi:trk system potassium uptake protein TrkH